ncbi:MAG: iron chelate uptake ABC transporter family permease subunit, partial [Nocardioidaceae bacterium]|nr:iron chelate uptake ABC transporter family permease subunit [Nocardioidaceae bacterium]
LLGGRPSVAAAALVVALLVLTADVVAHNLVPDVSLPVGVVTGAIGAPFLVYLLVAGNRRTT